MQNLTACERPWQLALPRKEPRTSNCRDDGRIHSILTSVGKVILLIVRRKEHVVLGRGGLLLEVFVLDLGELDHCGGGVLKIE